MSISETIEAYCHTPKQITLRSCQAYVPFKRVLSVYKISLHHQRYPLKNICTQIQAFSSFQSPHKDICNHCELYTHAAQRFKYGDISISDSVFKYRLLDIKQRF